MDVRTRSQWGARLKLGSFMPLPAQGLHVHHSVTNPDDVDSDMREIERIGEQRFGIFPYSYCIHPSGWIGEGAINTIGAHTSSFNTTSFGICFIGNYETIHLTSAQKEAFRELRYDLWGKAWLTNNHYVAPHRARKATACPGQNVINVWNELLLSPSQEDVMNPAQEDKLNRVLADTDEMQRAMDRIRGDFPNYEAGLKNLVQERVAVELAKYDLPVK